MSNFATKSLVLDLLESGPMTVDAICDYLYSEHHIENSKVRASILALRSEGKIGPNQKWEMALTN